MEKWKKIKGFENYEVSTHGNIVSLSFNKTGIRKKRNIIIHTGKCGYKTALVMLYKEGKPYTKRVSRLVAEAFLSDTYFEGAVCGHKDDNSLNNNVDNLY